MLLSQARTLMAADMSVRIFGMPTPEQTAALAGLEKRGVRQTWITETFTMASSGAVREPLLVSLKAVDPKVYPFYGTVRLDPAAALDAALDAQSVAATPDLLLRLRTKVGESIRIGGQEFRVAGALAAEPDRMTGSLNVGPRVMMSRGGLDRTGLISLGSRASERFLLRLPENGLGRAAGAQSPEARVSRRHDRGLSRDASGNHARPGPRHHVPEPDQPDHADRRVAGGGHRHPIAPAAAHGYDCDHEVPGRAHEPDCAHLCRADADAGPRRRAGRHDGGDGHRTHLPIAHRALLPGGRGRITRLAGGSGEPGNRLAGDAAFYAAAARRNPFYPAGSDFPAGNGGSETQPARTMA